MNEDNNEYPPIVSPASATTSTLNLSAGSAAQAPVAIGAPTSPDTEPLVQASDKAKEADAKIFRRLRALQADLGPNPNKHELAIVLIAACILDGWDTRLRIIGALRKLGVNQRHVALMLTKGTGSDPSRHHWESDSEGRYRLHPEQEGPTDA